MLFSSFVLLHPRQVRKPMPMIKERSTSEMTTAKTMIHGLGGVGCGTVAVSARGRKDVLSWWV